MLLAGLSGCRDFLPYQPSTLPTQPYGISGRVITANGVPIDSAAVKLFYSYEYESSVPMDTTTITIDNPPRIYSIDVFSIHGIHIRQLFYGYPPHGTLKRYTWDGKDDSNHVCLNGKYLIRYVRDTTVLKIVPVLIDEQVVTVSNGNGIFTIGGDYLPIGDSFDFYYDNGTFQGVYSVMPEVILEISRASLQGTFDITLQQNYNSIGDLKLQ